MIKVLRLDYIFFFVSFNSIAATFGETDLELPGSYIPNVSAKQLNISEGEKNEKAF